MNFKTQTGRWLTAIAVGVAIFAFSAQSWAQSCAMCYNSAAAAKASAIEALKQGIVVLLIPPLAMFIAIFTLAFRRRNHYRSQPGPVEPELSKSQR